MNCTTTKIDLSLKHIFQVKSKMPGPNSMTWHLQFKRHFISVPYHPKPWTRRDINPISYSLFIKYELWRNISPFRMKAIPSLKQNNLWSHFCILKHPLPLMLTNGTCRTRKAFWELQKKYFWRSLPVLPFTITVWITAAGHKTKQTEALKTWGPAVIF